MERSRRLWVIRQQPHTYSANQTGLTFAITASATDAEGTYFENDLLLAISGVARPKNTTANQARSFESIHPTPD